MRPLTERQQEIVELRLAGHSYKQIGEQLAIGDKTVCSHLKAARDNLGFYTIDEMLAAQRAAPADVQSFGGTD